jgi:hypothetical protein
MAGLYDNALTAARTVLFRNGVVPNDSPEYKLYVQILKCKAQTDSDSAQRSALYRRMDDLYYPAAITDGGADHWPTDRNLRVKGKVHVSLNNPPPYVDIPAALQAIVPYMNAVPDTSDKADLEAADRREKLYWLFWDLCDMDLNLSVVTQVRALYGAVAIKVFWNAVLKQPALTVLESPENLRIGWGNNNFTRKDWGLYLYTLSPQAVKEDYDLDVTLESVGGTNLMLVGGNTHDDPLGLLMSSPQSRQRTEYETMQVPVYDYWYKKDGKVWNAIYVGNQQVESAAHPEYDDIPYVYIPNGKLPGHPEGRPELYDIEQIFREIDERFSNMGQLIHKTLTKQEYQVIGSEAQTEFTANMMPGEDRPATPGPNSQLAPITAFIPAFPWSEYMNKLDQKLGERTGMSPLLLGLAGSNVLGSSKAINAELAMYVPRIRQARELLYVGLQELWTVVGKMWSRKDKDVAKVLKDNFRMSYRPPEITPRDDVEQAQRAAVLRQNGLRSQHSLMDMTGVENPTEELDIMRAENTDASLNPDKVMTLIQEILLARQAGLGGPAQAAGQAPQQAPAGQLNQALSPSGAPPPGGSNSANQQVSGTAQNTPENAQMGGAPVAPGLPLEAQTMLQNGKTTGRVLSSQKLPPSQIGG